MTLTLTPCFRGDLSEGATSIAYVDMSAKQSKLNSIPNGLVGALTLLEIIFPDEKTRPSLRWLREMQAKRLIPYRKIGGRMVYFDPVEVRRALDAQFTVQQIEK